MLLITSFFVVIGLARLDEESRSWADVFQSQNVPAMFLYTLIIYLFLNLLTGIFRGLARLIRRLT